MKNKILSLIIITIFLFSSTFVVLGEGGHDTKEKSLKIDELILEIEENLEKMPISNMKKEMLSRFIDLGIEEMHDIGITAETSVSELEPLSDQEFRLLSSRGHFFMLSFEPDEVVVSTMLPTYISNTSDNESEDNSSIEIFLKIVPLFDTIMTKKQFIFRKFYQSTSLIFPAIGLRLIENDETTFLIAFGMGISWYFRFF